jgi:preprotein translocase subunit SecG
VDYLVYTLHILVCVFLILVVLLQHGKGADFSVFGGGSTQTAFGSRGTTTFLHKLTVFSFVVFVFTTLTISILKSGGGSSVVHGAGRGKTAGKPAASAPAPKPGGSPARPAAATPTAPVAPVGSPAATPAGAANPAATPPAAPAKPPAPASAPVPGTGH